LINAEIVLETLLAIIDVDSAMKWVMAANAMAVTKKVITLLICR